MNVRNATRWTAALSSLAVLTFGSAAAAQWDPEGGDTGSWQGPEGQQPAAQQPPAQQPPAQQTWQQPQQQPPQGWQQPAQQPPAQQGQAGWASDAERPPAVSGDDSPAEHDHMLVVGNLGVGFFGFRQYPIGPVSADPTTGSAGIGSFLDVPTVGIRFWLNEQIGLDMAMGFGFGSGSFDQGNVGFDLDQYIALGLHAGLPVSLYHGEHYNFLIIPELNFGFADGSTPSAANPVDNRDFVGGFTFGVGARAGAEIQFGFIDIPELALQGTIGVHLDYLAANQDICDDASCTTSTQGSVSFFNVTTGVFEEPWDLFTGAITAIYYFR